MRSKFTVDVYGFKFVPQDLWIGIYWNTGEYLPGEGIVEIKRQFYVCLIPMLPFQFTVRTFKGTVDQG